MFIYWPLTELLNNWGRLGFPHVNEGTLPLSSVAVMKEASERDQQPPDCLYRHSISVAVTSSYFGHHHFDLNQLFLFIFCNGHNGVGHADRTRLPFRLVMRPKASLKANAEGLHWIKIWGEGNLLICVFSFRFHSYHRECTHDITEI